MLSLYGSPPAHIAFSNTSVSSQIVSSLECISYLEKKKGSHFVEALNFRFSFINLPLGMQSFFQSKIVVISLLMYGTQRFLKILLVLLLNGHRTLNGNWVLWANLKHRQTFNCIFLLLAKM